MLSAFQGLVEEKMDMNWLQATFKESQSRIKVLWNCPNFVDVGAMNQVIAS